MNQEQWTAVDRYFTDLLVPPDPALDAALAASAAAGLPAINVSPNQGKLLHLLARMQGARRILEIGTLGGYSTIWLARALPAGRPPGHARSRPQARRGRPRQHRPRRPGRASSTSASAARSTRCRSSPPRASARSTWSSSTPTSPSTADYFEWALKLSRPGSVIIVDNVVRKGAVIDAAQRRRRASRASAGSTSCSPPSRASAPRRSRPSAARATTASRSRSSPRTSSRNAIELRIEREGDPRVGSGAIPYPLKRAGRRVQQACVLRGRRVMRRTAAEGPAKDDAGSAPVRRPGRNRPECL